MSHKKGRIDEKGRDCNNPDHVGERYLPWDKFHKQPVGTNGKNSKCAVCINRQHRERRNANKEPRKKSVAKANREAVGDIQTACDSSWDGKAAADFLGRRK